MVGRIDLPRDSRPASFNREAIAREFAVVNRQVRIARLLVDTGAGYKRIRTEWDRRTMLKGAADRDLISIPRYLTYAGKVPSYICRGEVIITLLVVSVLFAFYHCLSYSHHLETLESEFAGNDLELRSGYGLKLVTGYAHLLLYQLNGAVRVPWQPFGGIADNPGTLG